MALYQLANEQLSKQHHYDWGLRSLKAVINSASKMRNHHHQTETCESVILIQALHQINLSKLVFEDIPLFLGLIKVIFVFAFSVCIYVRIYIFFFVSVIFFVQLLHVVFSHFGSCSVSLFFSVRLNLNDM